MMAQEPVQSQEVTASGMAEVDEAHDSSDPPSTALSKGDITIQGVPYTLTREGMASILGPLSSETKAKHTRSDAPSPPAQSVFFNPIQQFNRDLSVLAIKAFGEERLAAKRLRHEQNKGRIARKKQTRGQKRKRDNVNGTDAVADLNSANGASRSQEINSTDQAGEASGRPAEQDPKGLESEIPLQPKLKILDALSASGLRALRYARELPFGTIITANDLLPSATKSIKRNIEYNEVGDKVHAVTSNAMVHMYSILSDTDQRVVDGGVRIGHYDVIDLDPYGTAAPFLDAAVQALADGGLLCVTCTDSGVFASTGYLEKTFSLYGGTPLSGPHSHEAGLRLILHAIASSAGRYGLAMEPLLSLSIDYYARVFVRVRRSPAEVKFLAGKTMVVYSCDQGCGAWTTQLMAKNKKVQSKKGSTIHKHGLAQAPSASQNCPHCGFKTHLAGPMYAGPLHSPDFIRRILNDLPSVDEAIYGTKPRIEGMLVTALEEDLSGSSTNPTEEPTSDLAPLARIDPTAVDMHPFFFIPHAISKVIHCQTLHENALRGALRHLGYVVSRSHCKPGSIKTNAPWAVIWEIMRQWVQQRAPIREGAIKPGTAGWGVMNNSYKVQSDPSSPKQETLPSKEAEVSTSGEPESTSPLAATGGVSRGSAEPALSTAATPPLQVIFDEELGKDRHRKKVVRYQLNPTANWGPMNKAKG